MKESILITTSVGVFIWDSVSPKAKQITSKYFFSLVKYKDNLLGVLGGRGKNSFVCILDSNLDILESYPTKTQSARQAKVKDDLFYITGNFGVTVFNLATHEETISNPKEDHTPSSGYFDHLRRIKKVDTSFGQHCRYCKTSLLRGLDVCAYCQVNYIDSRHLNTVYFDGDKLFLICHNWGSSYILTYTSDGNLESKRFIGNKAHDIFRYQDDFWVASSGEGALVSFSGKRIELDGFPRGVMVDGEKLFVGNSFVRYKESDLEKVGVWVIEGEEKKFFNLFDDPTIEVLSLLKI